MPVLTITNQKGGVGKTTTTLNLAVALQERGWKVLTVDFDPQGSLTTCCGLDLQSSDLHQLTLADVLLTTVRGPATRRATLSDIIIASPAGVDLVPANKQLASAEAALYTVYGREYALRDSLESVRDRYDVILVDSVPTLGLLAINGLAAATGLIIPLQAEYLAVHGVAQVLESVSLVQERLNPQLQIWGVLLTMVDSRTRHSREVVTAVRETLPGRVNVFESQIPVHVRLKDSTKAGVSILTYDPHSRAATAYRELGVEVEARLRQVETESPRQLRDSFAAAVAATTRENLVAMAAAVDAAPTETVSPAWPPLPPPSDLPDQEAAEEGFPDELNAEAMDEGEESESASPAWEATNQRIAAAETENPLPLAPAPAAPPLVPVGERPRAVFCPKLGLLDDAAIHREWVSGEHRCYADDPPLEINNYTQRMYCLTDRYGTCGRYLRALPPKPANSQPTSGLSFFGRMRNLLVRSGSDSESAAGS
jgi:chromosome partitioning protein